jgi:hypothetical protein
LTERASRPVWIDVRVGFGIAVTVAAVWFALRGVSLPALAADLRRANLALLLPLSALCHLLGLLVRARRWQLLSAGLGELPGGPAYRATAIRFMVNNLFPLRLGELVGPWFVAREVGGSGAAWFGTIVVERAFDSAAIVSLALLLLGRESHYGWLPLLALVPMAGILALQAWPASLVRVGQRVFAFGLSEGMAARAGGFLANLASGLSSIRGAGGLAGVIALTYLLWCVFGTLPFWIAMRSLGIDLGSPLDDYAGSLLVMVGVGFAVALPQAPGFFGVYHAACREVLVPLGVAKEPALALGTLAHAAFWLSIVAFGLQALRGGKTSLAGLLGKRSSQ